ncbi:MAG: dephospho-CoA kinase [bacterium]
MKRNSSGALLIGVTGLIGCGKSTAAAALKSMGAAVVDADRIGHAVVDDSASLKQQLAHAFGSDILTGTGRVRRKLLAARAFASDKSRLQLNTLVHPYLLKELWRQVSDVRRRYPAVVIDAALLLDWDMDLKLDYTLVIHAGRRLRRARLAKRGISPAEARSRERHQKLWQEYRQRADRVILNNGTEVDLRRKVAAWYTKISCKDR